MEDPNAYLHALARSEVNVRRLVAMNIARDIAAATWCGMMAESRRQLMLSTSPLVLTILRVRPDAD